MSVRSRTAAPGTVLAVKAFGGQQNEPPGMAQAASVTSQMTMDHPFSPGEPVGPYDGYGGTPASSTSRPGTTSRPGRERHERVSFDTLRGLIESYDFAQICIWHRIDSLRSLDWKLVAADWYSGDVTDAIAIGMAALKKPDRIRSFEAWFGAWMFDVLAYDAGLPVPAAQPGRARHRPRHCRRHDNRTASRLLGQPARRAGGPRSRFPRRTSSTSTVCPATGSPSRPDLRAVPPRSNSPYGHAPLESIMLNANTDIRFQLYFLQRFTSGNIPEAFASAPEGWDPTQIEKFQAFWDSIMYGDQSRKQPDPVDARRRQDRVVE